ncbi:MAG: hypothetical protein SFX74_12280 [Fimbriimonadaceae bacterium]|nr:hypothetical protein [Fimbriimonadaceae bacterium]
MPAVQTRTKKSSSRSLRPPIPFLLRARPVAPALRARAGFEALLAALGVSTSIREHDGVLSVVAQLRNELIAEVCVDLRDGEPVIWPVIVAPGYEQCGLEAGMEAIALRALAERGYRFFEISQPNWLFA